MKYYLIAGEASGDLHGAKLIAALQDLNPKAQFRFWGGDQMQAVSDNLVKHYKSIAFMGFIEVLLNAITILRNLAFCKADLLAYKPDVLILIDFPGFNLRIASFARQQGIKVCYYISPKVWAWNQKRVHLIKKHVDLMLCILPFEVDFYARHNISAHYVGNPLLDAISVHQPKAILLPESTQPVRPIIALLPGSRKQEIRRILPKMLSIAADFPAYQLVIAGAPAIEKAYYQQFTQGKIPIVFGQTYDLLQQAKAALVTSGTATLEAALLQVPQVVCYVGHPLSIALAQWLVKIRFISLVNLVSDKKIVTELIQSDCNQAALTQQLQKILDDTPQRQLMLAQYAELVTLMGKPGASKRAAQLIIEKLQL